MWEPSAKSSAGARPARSSRWLRTNGSSPSRRRVGRGGATRRSPRWTASEALRNGSTTSSSTGSGTGRAPTTAVSGRSWPVGFELGDRIAERLDDYMAYYTIAHALQGGALRSDVPWAKRLDDGFFEYVFFGKAEPRSVAGRLGIDVQLLKGAKDSCTGIGDLRNTGKTWCRITWCSVSSTRRDLPFGSSGPRIRCDGYVLMAGKKMSKSRGKRNVWYIGGDPRAQRRCDPSDHRERGGWPRRSNVDLDFAEAAKDRWWTGSASRPGSGRRGRNARD